jgi:DNA (cytosine-5)-methyltransferase 1
MLTPQFLLPVHSELVIDLFAGGGGASTGIEQAIGRAVDIAVNHDPEAVSLHTANHPQTRHFCSDVFEVDPLTVTDGQPVGLLWASPDCKHFSKAKGGKPVSKKIRGLAWVVIKWAKLAKPRVICLENVEEFQTWGPLTDENRPCPVRKGQTFQRWKKQLENLGYKVEHRELRACDYGAPTIRKRLFLVARRDGLPIVWPTPTHAKPDAKGKVPAGMQPWRTAADCIDWSILAPSIFERDKPLADATCRRIAKGIVRYVMEAEQPFIVPGVAATLVQTGYGERPGQSPRVPGLDKPLGTVVAGQKHALVQAFLAKHYTGVVGHELDKPAGTVTTVDHHSLVTANLIHMGHGEGQCGTKRFSHGIRDVEDPLNTITAQGAAAGVVHSFLVKYYSEGGQDAACSDPMHTIPTKDRMGLVMVRGEPYAIVDIGLRMLTPRELYRAQGFPDSYVIDTGADGQSITKTAQVRMCGNSVCPPLSHALVKANYCEQQALRKAA